LLGLNYHIVCGDAYESTIRDLLQKCGMPNKKIHKGVKFVLQLRGVPIGCVRIILSKDCHSILLASLCVLPEFRGTGSGKYLMEYIHHWCRKVGVKNIYLAAVDKAVDFYHKLNYRDIALDAKVPYEFLKPMTKIFEEYQYGDYEYKITKYMLRDLSE
jgi:N-acetylglutamate synthase-like GNAT family acetyltransferase